MSYCHYCGTGLNEDDDRFEEHTGQTHYASRCREYVHAAKESCKHELLEWRSGKRRVFWRVRWTLWACPCGASGAMHSHQDWGNRKEAADHAKGVSGTLWRVTVRPRTGKGE